MLVEYFSQQKGEGRNAVFAAKLGWTVSAFGISVEGKKMCLSRPCGATTQLPLKKYVCVGSALCCLALSSDPSPCRMAIPQAVALQPCTLPTQANPTDTHIAVHKINKRFPNACNPGLHQQTFLIINQSGASRSLY